MSARRTCVHCVLARALAVEAATLAHAGVVVQVRAQAPVLLPRAAVSLYRELRALVRDATALASAGVVRVTIVDLPGRSCVEVVAAVPRGRRTRLLARVFARHVEGTLHAGFLEAIPLA